MFTPELVGGRRILGAARVSDSPEDWIVNPQVISAAELHHHRAGPGERFVLVDDRFVPGAGQYCIARRIPRLGNYGPGHVDGHVHDCDSLFAFLGNDGGYQGLSVKVALGDDVFYVDSPASVFVPAGVSHAYQVVGGEGTYLNFVLAGDYNSSLLKPFPDHGMD